MAGNGDAGNVQDVGHRVAAGTISFCAEEEKFIAAVKAAAGDRLDAGGSALVPDERSAPGLPILRLGIFSKGEEKFDITKEKEKSVLLTEFKATSQDEGGKFKSRSLVVGIVVLRGGGVQGR